ncbi:MAG TPA: VirB3 family type IV secretion system protein [Thermoanaerobaculia bacterium]|nr:VirB3 family type IV secretion system protein [Thermoanaerobaculia bacterium]
MDRVERRRDLAETPVHPSLTRPILMGGVEKDLAMLEILLGGAILALAGPSLATFAILALIVFAINPLLLAPLAERDPQAFAVYLRHIQYLPSYPAASTHHTSLRNR